MRKVLFTAALLVICTFAHAQKETVKSVTNVVCFLPSVTAVAATIFQYDGKGFVELGFSSVTAIALNYGLEAIIDKESPDGRSLHSFPSTHTLAAFNGATFLMRRYGWKYGVPAYAVASLVGWGRTYTGCHDWWDVLGGAAVGAASALIYTRPFAKDIDLTIAPVAYPAGGCGLYACINF